ncbi:Zinc finger protein 177 [Portunus trituberculatus]|uniref:Zinc finger protein 177 n=1 Tax=Portunus trituberculatus TaxID=210409 RepID=A0A5B7J0H2_PORTR|nr:Zinc finger protein 177 [Portunus trituberculatus]
MVECEHCGKKFSDQRSCHSHIRGVHDEARQMCRYCGKMFRRRCDLYQHERRHRTANLPCKYCDKIFKVGKDLQAHIATHEGGKRFHCSHCDKELTSYRNLKNHIASIHQKERPFACQQCKKTYSKASSLQVRLIELQLV